MKLYFFDMMVIIRLCIVCFKINCFLYLVWCYCFNCEMMMNFILNLFKKIVLMVRVFFRGLVCLRVYLGVGWYYVKLNFFIMYKREIFYKIYDCVFDICVYS